MFSSCWPKPHSPLLLSTGMPECFRWRRAAAVKALFARALQDVIILQIPAHWLEIGVGLLMRLAVRILGRCNIQALKRRLTPNPRSSRPLPVGGVESSVARPQPADAFASSSTSLRIDRRLLQPARPAQRVHVRYEMEIAVTPLPIREAIAWHRFHFHIRRQQIVAGVGALPRRLRDRSILRPGACPAADR